jgi:hypothetical protein
MPSNAQSVSFEAPLKVLNGAAVLLEIMPTGTAKIDADGAASAAVELDSNNLEVVVKVGGTIVATFDTNGQNIAGTLSINGSQVLTNRQPAIANPAATLADLQARLTDALNALRTHGLIAP